MASEAGRPLPLRGVRVLDLTRMLAGPYGTLLLVDLGADVVKVEDPAGGDPIRRMGPHFVGGDMSAYFLAVNRGKRSVALDLRTEAGRAALHTLVKVADVVVDNFRPGVTTRLGCDYQTLSQVNPKIVACSISAFGHTGPDRERPAFDLALQARGGAMSLTGEPDRAPVRMGIPLGDMAGGMFGALAVSAALYEREKTGHGQWIDISLLDCQVSLLAYMGQFFLTAGDVLGPQGSGHRTVVPYRVFRAADGWMVVAVFQEKFWAALCRALDRPDLQDDPRFADNEHRRENREGLESILESAFAGKPLTAWLDRLEAEGVPSAPVNDVEQALLDPQVLEREMQVILPLPGGDHRAIGTSMKMHAETEAWRGLAFGGPPALGEHTELVLREWAGMGRPGKVRSGS